MPEGEEFELELVTGERWLGYARYLGGLRTRIQVNTDLPLPAADLVCSPRTRSMAATTRSGVWQETELVRGQGQLERTLDVLWSPEAVISEGVAMTGPTLLVGDGQELASEVLGRLGFAYDAEIGSWVDEARGPLRPIAANVAMLLHDRGAIARGGARVLGHVVAPARRAHRQAGRLAAAESLAALPAHLLAGAGARRGARRAATRRASGSC